MSRTLSFSHLLTQGVVSAVLATLAQAGVLEALLEGPVEVEAFARKRALDPGALARSLSVLAAAGYLDAAGGRYTLAPGVAEALDEGPMPLRFLLELLCSLPEHLQSGRAYSSSDSERQRIYQTVTPALAKMWDEPAAALARRLPPARRILDVGAGAGPWSLAMARAAPEETEVTALDLPPVLEAFRSAAQADGVRHRLVAGSYHEVELDPTYDRVILANVLHLERPDLAQNLLTRASGWLAPGGTLVIVDAFPFPEAELHLCTYALHLGLRIQGGEVHAEGTLRAWCEAAGLETTPLLHLPGEMPLGALVARRP